MIWQLFNFIEIREIENDDFWNKNAFYKTKVVNLFLNNFNFIKIILKPSFTYGNVLREN